MNRSRTKIVCTIGPASSSPEVIRQLISAGMSVARLNFSHGSHHEHAAVIESLRTASRELGRPVAILQDLCGPKMRLGTFAGSPVNLKAGDRFVLTSRDVPGDASLVSFNWPHLIQAVKCGHQIFLGDGLVELRVESTTATDIACTVIHGGPAASRQGISAPGAPLKNTVPTPKDLADLEFGIRHEVDLVAQSFIRKPEEVRAVKDFIKSRGADIPVIVKVEKRECMANLDAIIDEADGVMVARGDLGLEIGLEQVPFAQKEIIRKASLRGKSEITATQMLESMIANPRPTRAEISDVANAVLDDTEAVMLSGETAIGRFPVEACRTLARVAAATEAGIDYIERFRQAAMRRGSDATDAVAHAACHLALQIGAKAVICCTRSGLTAQLVAKYRPDCPIAVVSPYDKTLRRCMLFWGAEPVKTELSTDTDSMIASAKKAVLAAGIAEAGQPVVIVAGIAAEADTAINTIKTGVL
ncbi:MAG TPA: pyruvate kinase [Sedimentisphaerales bacterium]|nr:pyruvate kinase [Sedimentisphaerales bacterium]